MNQKRLLLAMALVAVVAAAVVVAVVFAARPQAAGRIELSAAEFDFGTIPNTGPVSQVFRVHNAGDGPLEIEQISTSCGCTTAEITSRRLASDDTTDLKVTYDPLAHGGATGEFLRIVYVRSSDPDTPEARLTIRATVVEP